MMEGLAAMNMRTIGDVTAAEVGTVGDYRAALRQMTAEQLRHLGVHQVVYLRGGMSEGETHFVLFGADGAPLARTDAVEAAVELAAEQGLKFISIH
jgi:hypothetical protein